MLDRISHSWIPHVLSDIEAFAILQKQSKVAELISAARSAVTLALGNEADSIENIGAKEEQWLGTVLDELARYCHVHGLTETKEHLLATLDSWHEVQETEDIGNRVITFRPKNF